MASCSTIYRVSRVDTITYDQLVAAPSVERAIEFARAINVEEASRVIHREWRAKVEREAGE